MWTINLQDREHACWEEASIIRYDRKNNKVSHHCTVCVKGSAFVPSDRTEWGDSSFVLQLPCSRMQEQDVCVFWSEWSQDHQQPLPVWVQGPHVSTPLATAHLSHSSCSCLIGPTINQSHQVDTHPDRTPPARLPAPSAETLRPHYGCLWSPPVCIWRSGGQHFTQRTALLRCGLSELGGDPS